MILLVVPLWTINCNMAMALMESNVAIQGVIILSIAGTV
jgi:hypothetical protein